MISEHLKSQLSPFVAWDQQVLENLIHDSNQSYLFYTTLSNITRITGTLLGFAFLVKLGDLNPTYVPISICLLKISYHPFMSMTCHRMDEWIQEALAEEKRYQGIIHQLDQTDQETIASLPFEIPNHSFLERDTQNQFNKIMAAQYQELESQLKPILDRISQVSRQCKQLEVIYRNNPNEESLQNQHEAKSRYLQTNNKRIKIIIEQAFICYISKFPFDQRKISDFGHYPPLPIHQILSLKTNDFPIFVLKSGHLILPSLFNNCINISDISEAIFNRE